MWKKLGKNSLWTVVAAVILSAAELFSGYESSKVNVNLEQLTDSLMVISEMSTRNSEKVDETQREMLKLQKEVYINFDKTQRQMITLQEKVFNRVWEQDKVISQIRRDTVLLERENIVRMERLNLEAKIRADNTTTRH